MTQHFDRYTCEEMLRRLDDYLDRELSAEEIVLVEEHLQDCEACSREFGFEASVIRAVRSKLREVDVPQSLRDSIATSLTRERANERDDGAN
jgi:anti-sigma factor (TIGR02949 family)